MHQQERAVVLGFLYTSVASSWQVVIQGINHPVVFMQSLQDEFCCVSNLHKGLHALCC